MAEKKEKQTAWQRRFSEGFTGKKLGIKKPKKIMTEREAAERRRRRNAKYDQSGHLR